MTEEDVNKLFAKNGEETFKDLLAEKGPCKSPDQTKLNPEVMKKSDLIPRREEACVGEAPRKEEPLTIPPSEPMQIDSKPVHKPKTKSKPRDKQVSPVQKNTLLKMLTYSPKKPKPEQSAASDEVKKPQEAPLPQAEESAENKTKDKVSPTKIVREEEKKEVKEKKAEDEKKVEGEEKKTETPPKAKRKYRKRETPPSGDDKTTQKKLTDFLKNPGKNTAENKAPVKMAPYVQLSTKSD